MKYVWDKRRENKKHTTVYRKTCRVWDNEEKYSRARQATYGI